MGHSLDSEDAWSTVFAIIVNDLLPIAILVLGIAIAVLLRRVEFPLISERIGSAIVALLGVLLVHS